MYSSSESHIDDFNDLFKNEIAKVSDRRMKSIQMYYNVWSGRVHAIHST